MDSDNGVIVIVSGIPASGKTTVGRALAPLLNIPVLDKDDILERLFDERGVGDDTWRRQLSREADALLEAEVSGRREAIAVSFWRVPGMPPETGTPTEWLSALSRAIIHIECVCPPEVAAQRYVQRTRHAGHLDQSLAADEVLGRIEALSNLASLEIGEKLVVDTTHALMPALLAADVRATVRRLAHFRR